MTIKEFYEWAVENKVEDFEIEIQHRDSGGYYSGTDELYKGDIDIDNRARTIYI